MQAASTLLRPVFQVDVPAPTKDKPQSKLWFAHGAWWAWLPVRGGSAIWKRTHAGWRRDVSLDAALQGYPGQADVWADEDGVAAVLVAPDQLAVIQLAWDRAAGSYRVEARPERFSLGTGADGKDAIETATIARHGRDRLWIAYNWRRSMWVRASGASGSIAWTPPVRLNRAEASSDDICAIVGMSGAVGVLWSDQEHDAVYFRLHSDGAPEDSWGAPEVADSGGKTADDHINAAVGRDGTLYVATKNSIDQVGRPQLVLRVRDLRGRWTNIPYAERAQDAEPTRPVVLLSGDPDRVFLLHTLGWKGRKKPASQIVCQTTAPANLNLGGKARVLIEAERPVNNVTRAKSRSPRGQDALVLASDDQGQIYESRVS